ncbi:GMC oxidoreductase [Myriangium duriaei CBS 260.36]|uniref:GMC oxidoreductase n=1 Tax=Myriangium duriaei CBS 260.36 TaxID=1168546 RepID=A0A9P4J302_9PEZI|nr:GMC oxidoreductase [Myriangium duriaei CBS 260.36]
MSEKVHDFIIVGGGVAGCVLAGRLREANPDSSILLLETGDDARDHDITQDVSGFPHVRGSVLDYAFDTVPQAGLGGRVMQQWAGKCLGGSGSINAAGWTRGPACDYDRWAVLTGDDSWNYENMLPYFRKTETYNAVGSDTAHGKTGPLQVKVSTRAERLWPMHDLVGSLWASEGLKWNKDLNSGSPLGYGYPGSLWNRGKRQFPQVAYDVSLDNTKLGTKVHKILFHLPEYGKPLRARGLQTVDGQVFEAKEIILCAGVYASPQILLHSGIGPREDLSKLGIEVLVPNDEVGKNLRDDLNVRQIFKLASADIHGGVGNPAVPFAPELFHELPIDHFAYTQAGDREAVLQALRDDGIADPDSHPLMHPDKVHQEVYIMYLALLSGIEAQKLGIQQDGTCITTSVYNMAPTSRGTIRLASNNPNDRPIIDPAYLSSKVDRVIMRDALRRVYRLLMFPAANAGPATVLSEVLLDESHNPLTRNLTDEECDARIMHCSESGAHPSGTCAMGKVTDSRLRVFGTEGLRVIDASSFPDGISAHIQAAVYALAEQGADMLISDTTRSVK